MFEVAITGLSETIGTLREAQRQVPFASAQACNDTAKDVQTWTIRDRLPQTFTLRARGAPWWKPGTRQGFNIKFASKAKPEAVLGSQADWLKLQEDGGSKTAGGHRIAIPTSAWKARTELMVASKKPRALRKAMDSVGRRELTRANENVAHLNRTRARVFAAESRARSLAAKGSGLTREQRKKQSEIANALRSKRHVLTAAEKRAHRARTGLLKQQDRTQRLLGSLNNTPFMAKTRNGLEGMFVREGKGRLPITKLFTFVTSSSVHAVLGWEKAAATLANAVYPSHFTRRWMEAMRTRL